jgi:hypothetical protein
MTTPGRPTLVQRAFAWHHLDRAWVLTTAILFFAVGVGTACADVAPLGDLDVMTIVMIVIALLLFAAIAYVCSLLFARLPDSSPVITPGRVGRQADKLSYMLLWELPR